MAANYFVRTGLATRASGLSVRAESANGRKVKVEFRLPKKVKYGSAAYVIGNAKGLGEWKENKSMRLKWTDGDVWQGSLEVEAGESIEYKYIVKPENCHKFEWQACSNQQLMVEEDFQSVVVTDNWKGNRRARDVIVERLDEDGEEIATLEVTEEPAAEKEPAEAMVPNVNEEVVATRELAEEVVASAEVAADAELDPEEVPAVTAEENTGPVMVPVRFRVRKQLDYGQELRMVGGNEQMGLWGLSGGLQMQWTNGDVWRAQAFVNPGETIEYKYVVVGDDGHEEWQEGFNKQLTVQEGSASVQVKDFWQADQNSHIEVAHGVVTEHPPPELLKMLQSKKQQELDKEEAVQRQAQQEEEQAAAAAAAAALAAEEELEAQREADLAAEEELEAQREADLAAEAAKAVAELNAQADEPTDLQEVPLPTDQVEVEEHHAAAQIFDIVTPSGRLMRNMTVKELKAELKDLGLRTVGRKAELVVRLHDYLSSQDES